MVIDPIEEEAARMFHNGEVWQNTGSCIQAVTQWIDRDQWCLLGAPDKAVHGGTCMMICSGRGGQMFYTRTELEQRLVEFGWFKTGGVVELRND